MDNKIKIVLTDINEDARLMLQSVLERSGRFIVTGSTGDGNQALQLVRETKPDLVIAIDALAARSIRRLGTTIQVTDTGIHPGSGVGNHRHGLTRESLGVPVIAIGVPTVVGTAAIVHDTVSVLIQTLLEHAQTREIGGFLDQLDSDEQYRLICELLEPEFGQMYVTPPDIDQTIKAISYTISEAIHMAFFGGE